METKYIKMHFRNTPCAVFDNQSHIVKETDETDIIATGDNQLSELLFAPDPNTGIPRSDLAVLMSKDTRPEIAAYIRDNLLRPRDHSAGVNNADIALELTQGKYERLNEYAQRLQEIANQNSVVNENV